jgi:hypothetical protein
MRIGTVLGSAAPAEAHTLHGFFTMVNVLPGSAAGSSTSASRSTGTFRHRPTRPDQEGT